MNQRFGPPMRKPPTDGLAKPTRLGEYPAYIKKKIQGFFHRFTYIVGLVYKATPALLIVMCLLCLLDGVLPVLGAFVSAELLNEIQELITQNSWGVLNKDSFETFSPLLFMLLLNLIYIFMRKVINRVSIAVTAIAGELVSNHIKLIIINKSRSVDMASFDNPEFYEKLENANREAGMRPLGIITSTFSVISSIISAVSFVVILSGVSIYISLIMIAAAIPSALVNFFFRNKNFRYIRWHSKERRQMNYYSSLMVNKDMAKEIKILGLSDTFIKKYKAVFEKYFKGLKKLYIKEGIAHILASLLSTLVQCGVFLYIAYTVIFEGGMIGDYSLYSGALTSISTYVATVLTATATIYEGTLFIDNMIAFTKEEVTVVPCIDEPLTPDRNAQHKIEFKNVSFKYPGTDKFVLKNVNLTLQNSENIVLVGLNGAGKTTLIKLLTRLYDPTEGEILLDGRNIKEYDVAALHDMFGIIFQDFGKYSETASDNIRFGDVLVPHDEGDVHLAAERGNAKEFIEELPHGFDTPLTRIFEEDGIELSGGSWQKLAISRAFLKDSDILILDEPTASLDPLAEAEVFNRFTELSRDRITVFVSHRLSSATTADKIVVIDGGTIAEIGTHNELMTLGGIYHNLFTTQAERYREK